MAPTFDTSQTGGFFQDPSGAYSSFSQAGNAAANLGSVNHIQQQLAQLQQLQLMQSAIAGPNAASNQQIVDMQQNLLAQMQLATQSNIPPRFQQQQQQQMMPAAAPSSDMGNMMAEQLAIQQQLENLRAQQDALLNRFAEMQNPATSPQQLSQSPPGPGAGFSSIAAAAARTGHRRHQSQQAQGSATMGSFGGFPAGGAMGQFGLNSSTGSSGNSN